VAWCRRCRRWLWPRKGREEADLQAIPADVKCEDYAHPPSGGHGAEVHLVWWRRVLWRQRHRRGFVDTSTPVPIRCVCANQKPAMIEPVKEEAATVPETAAAVDSESAAAAKPAASEESALAQKPRSIEGSSVLEEGITVENAGPTAVEKPGATGDSIATGKASAKSASAPV
jgi:hypothetical protein